MSYFNLNILSSSLSLLQPAWQIVPQWATNKWLIFLSFIVAGAMVVYLYKAQQKIASKRVITILTAIRVALIVLTFVLLAGLSFQWKRTGSSGGTLWLVLDQSGSMSQADPQATPTEKMRIADAMSLFPAELRTSRLDRKIAQLQSLRSDLAFQRTRGELAAESAEVEKRKDEFLAALEDWNKKLSTLAGEIEKDPALVGTDGAAVKSLRATFDKIKESLSKAATRSRREEAAGDVGWADMLGQLDTVLAQLRPLADQTDLKFLTDKGADPALVAALDKVSKMTRADIAYAALTEKTKHGGTNIADLVPRQKTRIVSFAGSPQVVEVKEAADFSAALKNAPSTGKSTNVASALQFIAQQLSQEEPASVIVLSDGRQNVGGDLVEPSRALAARGVRVFTLGLGSTEVAPDAAVEQIDSPDWIFKDDTLKASALLRLDGLKDKPVKVEFRRGETLLESETKTVTPRTDRETTVVSFSDKPAEPGTFEYSVRVVPVEGEAVKENNSQARRVSVKKGKLKILIVEDQPRWEYRYLANYLQRDQRVKLQTVLMQPAVITEVQRSEPRKASPTNDRTEAELLPATKEEWAAFDMIVLGDVPKEQLNDDMQRNIVSAVKERGATVLLIAGMFNMPQRFGSTPLQELLPVDLSTGGWSAEEMSHHLKDGYRAGIAPEGVNSVLTQFTVDSQANNTIWSTLPPLYWHSEYTQVRAASVIWSIEPYSKNPTPVPAAGAETDSDTLEKVRRRALLSTSAVGAGRVMYLATDSTWRFRQVNGMNLHERFWGQVIRWVVGSDMPAGGTFVRFGANKARYVAGEPVIISSRILGEDFAPLKDEKVKVVARLLPDNSFSATKPAAEGKVVGEAELVMESPGSYRTTLGGLPAGTIELSIQGDSIGKLLDNDESVTSKTLNIDIASQLDVEQRNINADREALAGIARAGGGIALDATYADVVAGFVPALNYTTDSTEQFGLFADPKDPNTKKAHWVFLSIFVVLASAEWIIRKATGLV